jgi:tRNA(Ile2) C34 agmatinyltransferase TiaS
MERFPRGSLPPYAFPAVATLAPQAIAKAGPVDDTVETGQVGRVERTERTECDLSTTCPSCGAQMQPEHAHYKCPACGYRDSCCF